MGQVLTSTIGQNPARQASINAGIPVSKPAHIVNQLCGSGLRTVASVYQSIKLKENKIVTTGGQESMSKAPHVIFYREEKKLSETNNSFFLNFYEAKFFVSKTLSPNLVYY